MEFLVTFRPPRKRFPETMTASEREVVLKHFLYLQGLHGKGTLVMAGRRVDGETGIAVLKADDETAARALMERDPAVAGGIFSVDVVPFQIAIL